MNQSFAKISAFCDAHLFYLIYNSSQGQQSAFCSMSDQSDSQNRSEEQMDLSVGTSPSTTDEGSRSTPSNLPKAATRARKKRTSDSEDEDYVVVEDEATSNKKVMKK